MPDKINWEYDHYDFSSIQETISKYFPIENLDQYNEKNIRDFKEMKAIQEILNDNFFTTRNYTQRWRKFKKLLKEELKKPIRESMIAYFPCYSGILTLKKEKHNNLTYTKELHFYISLLGPFYTIIGTDRCELTLEELPPGSTDDKEAISRTFNTNVVVTVSPYLEFREAFLLLQKKILEYFPALKFIPNDIYRQKSEGVSLVYPVSKDEAKGTVFSALFRPDNIYVSETRGDSVSDLMNG